MPDTRRSGRHRQETADEPDTSIRRRRGRATAIVAGVSVMVVILLAITASYVGFLRPARQAPAAEISYIGVYAHGTPESYAGITAFSAATGVKPGLTLYYSGWLEPFQAGFASTAAKDGAMPLVQIDPTGVDIAAIASGRYDSYLSTYAKAVRAYRHRVVLGFGHEMNGYWYSWAYKHTSAATFVAAWRHIVSLFRAQGAQNVTWMWTVNATSEPAGVPSPGPWWPGNSYVNWVGIDGYYTRPSDVFASLFGPTIADVRRFTRDPIIVSETSATAAAGQPAKIADLFAGVHLYGLLGFVWFDSVHTTDWRLTSAAALAAFRREAAIYDKPASL